MKYTDKNGEFFSLIVGLFETVANVVTHGVNFNNYDWDKTSNAWKIDAGWFKGNIGQILSRFTWELPQTILGYAYGQVANVAGKVDNVQYYGGATVIKTYGDDIPWFSGVNGVTLGSFITGNNTIEANPNNSLFQHEYGHYLQSQKYGFAYLPRYGIPSARGDESVEFDANSRAFSYFYNETGGNFTWDFRSHTLNDGVNWGTNPNDFYNNPAFQLALSGSLVSPNWYDYVAYPLGGYGGIGIAGLFHPIRK